MKSHGRSACHDSPRSGDGQPCIRSADHTAILVVSFILFATILIGVIVLGYRHMETATHTVLTGDKTTASLLAAFITEHNKATLGIIASTANRPPFIAAVRNKDSVETGRHLSALQSGANIDLTFVTDPQGLLWINFPYFPEAIGKDLSHREWYKGISRQWKPHISSVFQLIVADKPLAVAMSVPVYDEQEKVIGILSSSQRLDFLKQTVEGLPITPDSRLSVIDQTGHMLYSNTYPYREQLAKHPLSANIFKATQGNPLHLTLADEQQDRDSRYLTVVPVGGSGWSVIVERSRQDIFQAEMRHFRELGLTALLIYTLGIVFFAYLRKIALVKRTEKLLQAEQELEDKFKHIFDSSVTGISITRPSGEVEVNQAFATMLGYAQDELNRKHWQEISHPDDIESTKQAIAPLLAGKDGSVRFSKRYLHKNGSIVWADVGTSLRRDNDGKPLYFITSVNDVTERKKAEAERLRLLHILESSLNEIYIFGPESLVFEYVNQGALDNLGYTLEEIKTMTPVHLKPEFTATTFRRLIEPLLGNEHDKLVFETVHRRYNGSLYPVEVHLQLVQIEDRQVFLAIILNISERRKAEEEHRLFTEELARSNVDLQQFAHVASHDLQEPLRMVSSYLQLIERRYKDHLDDDANTFIHYAVDGANRMQDLIVGLLEFTRIRTHGQDFAPVEVMAILQAVCRNLHSLIVESGAVVRYEKLPVIRADEAQITRLFQNLLQNALKFRREGIAPVIKISAEKTAAGQVFSVHDNGIGIEQQYFERIFTIFQRLHTREQYPGTGIGLAICKRIVERHGGKIWLESSADAGTTFYFSIPGDVQ